MDIPENESVFVARRIVRAAGQCRTGGQLEFVRWYALLASRRYGVDLMPLLAMAERVERSQEGINAQG